MGEIRGPNRTLFHYTDSAGQVGILRSLKILPSLKAVNPKDARYGDGQYFSDIIPGSCTCAQLSARFVRLPYFGWRFTHYVEVDITGLSVVSGREHVFVVPGQAPLDVAARIAGWGVN